MNTIPTPPPKIKMKSGKQKPFRSVASTLVDDARRTYHLCADMDGRPFAVLKSGHALAIPLDGSSISLRAALAVDYYRTTTKVAGRQAVTEAIEVLRGEAMEQPRVTIDLRHGRASSGARVVDLGDEFGSRIVLADGDWTLEAEEYAGARPLPRPLFRRTKLTAAFPEPSSSDPRDLGLLRKVLNVSDRAWPLTVAWMVGVTLGDLAMPIVFLTGEQGVGKTAAAKVLVAMTDPSTAPVRGAAKDVESWVVAASGSRVVALDNLSTLSEWMSDALCRAVTGDGLVRRTLYTDSELSVLSLRRAVILTSIDMGALRGDLTERMLPIELEVITRRITDDDLAAMFAEMWPPAFGALLALTAEVADRLDLMAPSTDLPRMADFGRVLLALDDIKGWTSAVDYADAIAETFRDLAVGDIVLDAIVRVVTLAGGRWSGNATELLDAIRWHRPEDRRAAWPQTPRVLASIVKRNAPALRAIGVEVVQRKAHEGRRVLELAMRPT